MKGSYDINKISIHVEKEINRLNGQLDLFWEQELALYKRAGLVDGMSILDCGCGPGYLLEKLLKLYPEVHCTGIDASETLVKYARNYIVEDFHHRCKIENQSVISLKFSDETFDFVIMRLVLEHLPKPLDALNEVKRVLKKGGQVILINNDFDFHPHTFPNIPELSDLYKAYCVARTEEGGNPVIGRQLPNLLVKAGFSNVFLDVVTAQNTLQGDKAFSRSEGAGIALQLVHSGHLNSETYDRLALQWSNMLQHPDHAIVRILFVAAGVKTEEEKTADNNSTNEKSSITLDYTESVAKKGEMSLSDSIQKITADALKISTDELNPAITLDEYGIDSIASVALRNSLENEFHVSISSLDFFINNSTQDIIALVTSQTDTAAQQKSNESDGNDSESYEEGTL